jgi:uncharacterized membrane protein
LLLTLAGSVVALLPAPGPGADPPEYKVTDLPVPDGFATYLVRSLTESGTIYGLSRRANGEQTATYWFPEGAFRLLPVTAGVKFSRLLGGNEWGDLVGDQWTKPTGNHRATVWVSDQPYMLGRPGEHSVAYAINRIGTMVGAHGPSPNSLTACEFRADGRIIDLATFPSSIFSQATKINERGDVAGDWVDRTARAYRPFVRSADGKVTDLGVLPGFVHSLSQGINSAGDVVGMSLADLTGTGRARAFYYSARRNRLFALPTPDNFNSIALGMNDLGEVAGFIFAQGVTPPRGIPSLWRRISPTAGPRIAQLEGDPAFERDNVDRQGELNKVANDGSGAGNTGSGSAFRPYRVVRRGARRGCGIVYIPAADAIDPITKRPYESNSAVPVSERVAVYCMGECCELLSRPHWSPTRDQPDPPPNIQWTNHGKHGKDNPLQYDLKSRENAEGETILVPLRDYICLDCGE